MEDWDQARADPSFFLEGLVTRLAVALLSSSVCLLSLLPRRPPSRLLLVSLCVPAGQAGERGQVQARRGEGAAQQDGDRVHVLPGRAGEGVVRLVLGVPREWYSL